MSKQTAMQQLINEIVEHLTYDDDLSNDSRMILETIRLRCLRKLSVEKEQIIDIVFEILHSEFEGQIAKKDLLYSAEQYYNETFDALLLKGGDLNLEDITQIAFDVKERHTKIPDENKGV